MSKLCSYAPKKLLLLPLLFVLAGTLPAIGQQCNSNDPGAPCFAGNKDILNGRRSLLQDDDLVVSGNLSSSDPSGSSAESAFFLSSDSQLSPVTGIMKSGQKVSSNTIAASARMFATKNAVGISAFASYTSQGNSSVRSFFSLGDAAPTEVDILNDPAVLPNCNQQLYSVSADFTGNGYDDVVFGAFFPGGCLFKIGMIFKGVQATNPLDTASGFTTGPASQPYITLGLSFSLTAGTFTDPAPNAPPPLPQIAQLSEIGATGNGLEIKLFSVDPATLLVADTGKSLDLTLPEGSNANIAALAVAAGRFSGGNHDQLAVAYAVFGGTAKIITVDFDTNDNPIQQTIHDTGIVFTSNNPSQGYPGSLFLQKGRFNFFGDADQAGLSVEPGISGAPAQLEVLSFDDQLNTTEGPRFPLTNFCHYAMAVGRFDRMQGQPSAPDPNLQMTDASTNCLGTSMITMNIYDVDPSTFAISLHSAFATPYSYLSGGPNYSSKLGNNNTLQLSVAAADLQGRSLPLGPPEKATITGHIQPDTVLGVPPMHVDWVMPADSNSPSILNVSVFPSTFNTTYQFQSSQQGSATTSQTTSYTVATKETAQENVSYGIPGLGVDISAQQALGQMHQNTVGRKYNTYQGTQTNLNTATRFDDELAATASQMNIYSYRVLGECTPSTGAPGQEGCPAGTKPYYIQLSGPDNVEYLQFAEGRNLEWYQPVQEPGNIFSYPGSLTQLEANLPASTPLQALTPTDNLLDVQGNGAVAINWTQGNGSDQTSGTVNGHSFDASVSVSSSVNLGFFSGGGSVGFDYNKSSSVSTLNQSSSSIASSQGVTVNRGINGTGGGQPYDYALQAIIFGQQPVPGTIQNDITQTVQVQSNGFIDVGWIADPLSTGGIQSGNFWLQAYGRYPDVALNHPQRWLQKQSNGVHGQQVMFQCPVGYTSSFASPACAAVTPVVTPTPVNVANDGFYQIKGLFVTPGGTTAGPQITNVMQGQSAALRVRVYNYSVQQTSNLPPGTTLRVQFYAQPWNATGGQFAAQSGNPNAFQNAVFIGEGTDPSGNPLLPVPAFCGGVSGNTDPCTGTGASTRNWIFAHTAWNTTSVPAGSYWKFWVVTWLEANGKMVPELTGHGLPASTLAACLGKRGTPCFSNIGAVAVADLSTMNFETYSNNFGYYNQVFSVLASAPPGESAHGDFKLTQVKSPGGSMLLRNQPARIEAHHKASGRHYDNVLALYYDGDPGQGGVQYDAQLIPRVTAGATYIDAGNYEPRSCGIHRLYVRSIPMDGSAPTVSNSTTVRVTIDSVAAIDETLSYVDKLKLDPRLKTKLILELNQAREAFKAGHTASGRSIVEEFLEFVQHESLGIPADAIKAIIDEGNDLLDCTRLEPQAVPHPIAPASTLQPGLISTRD